MLGAKGDALWFADLRQRISDLLVPGTPDDVRELYLRLPEMALVRSFGPIEEDVVFLDTETTGLSFSQCELIEIAAARISGREVTERFHTFVNPKCPIPAEIKQLTGITDLDVRDAPNAVEAVKALAEFVGGSPVLAHNVIFDRTFIESVPGGKDVSDIWIDTLSLSRIALPMLSSHKLSDMAQAFGCDSVTHRAPDDVDALCGMWRIMLCGLLSLPQGLPALLADMAPEADWPHRPILSCIAMMQGGEKVSFKQVRKGLVASLRREAKADPDALDEGTTCQSEESLRQEFGEGGLVARMYDRYETRPEQVEMAELVRKALESNTHCAIEAGTGVGKSMAYLLPLVDFARRNGITVGVATKTNALTDQLMSRELPSLDRAIPGGVEFCGLKGYDHYPCLRKVVSLAMAHEEALDGVRETGHEATLTAIATVLAYVSQAPEGDLDGLGIRWKNVPRSKLTTTPHECQRTRCPFYPEECLLHGARRRAACADVVVTNHSLLLLDVQTGGRILPPIRHWVVDEAHGLEAEARRQWAVEVSGEDARGGFERLGGTKTGVIHSLMVQASGMEGSTTVVGLLTKLAAASARAQVACADLFESVHDLVGVAERPGGYESVNLWIDDTVRSTPEWGAVSEAGVRSADLFAEASKCANEAVQVLGESSAQMAADLSAATAFLDGIADAISLIVEGEDDTYVYSAQLSRQRKRISHEKLVAEKIDIGAEVAQKWLPETRSVCLTSATMAVGKDFSHFSHAIGLDTLDQDAYRCVKLDSSFDFDANMCALVPRDLPAPNNPRYLAALERLLFDVHKAMDGSVLTLFTNRKSMETVYESLAPKLSKVGLELVCQERTSSTRLLGKRFLAEKSLSMFALKSFWEGFDAAGDTLRCVVITKLPFASPSDPLVRVREQREDRAWMRYSLPEAVIEVKQAAGRLIRSSTDTGIVVLCDSRVATKGYGKHFVESLPTTSCMTLESKNIGRFIESWRRGHERPTGRKGGKG